MDGNPQKYGCKSYTLGLICILFVLNCLNNILFENRSCISLPSVKEIKGYDSKIKGIYRERLGFALTPEFQVVPKNSTEVMEKLKERFSKTKSSKKTLNILVFRKPGWGNFHSCPHMNKSEGAEFNCEFTEWPNNSTNITFEDILTKNNFDAIFVYRSFQSREPISLGSIYNILSQGENSNLNPNHMPKLIFFTMESPGPPHDIQIQFKLRKNFGPRIYFGSYWRGSDFYRPYNNWVYFNNSVTRKAQDKNYANGRTKMAAIAVSNCRPNNNRMGLVKALQQYVPVDIFGKCGILKCRKEDLECFQEISKKYKFYLAFENSNCRDYITEKLFDNAYGLDLLPIVFGAHPSDYKVVAPKNSYIHIEDFDSIEKLGQYLHILNQNDTLYNEYFEWKGTGNFAQEQYMCPVCARLHADNLREAEKSQNISLGKESLLSKDPLPYFNNEDTYDFDKFNWTIHDERLCLKPNEWFWNK